MTWETAERVQKNAAGEYRALIGGEWVQVAKAQKSASGQYRIDRGMEQPQDESMVHNFVHGAGDIVSGAVRGAGNVAAGAVRGAGSIGATLLTPFDYAARKMGVENSFIGRDDRRASMDDGLQSMGADTDSLAYGGGKLAGEIAGTAGIGGAIGRGVMAGAKYAPTLAPKLAAAIQSGGLSTGAPSAASAFSVEALKNAGTRIGGGAVAGGAMAGMINPEEAGTGVMIGAAFPVAGKLAGESGRLLREYAYNPLFKPSKSAINQLVKDAGGVEQAKMAIEKAIAAGKTLSGESYTLGQAGKNAGLAATERARSAVNPENYQGVYQAQRDARIAAMQKIAGGSDDLARADSLEALKQARSGATEDLYAGMQDAPFMLGREGERLMTRARPYGALGHAEKLAATQGRKFSIPVVEDVATSAQSMDDIAGMQAARQTHPDMVVGGVPEGMPTGSTKDLLTEIRRMGGVSMRDTKDLMGERQITKMGVQGGVFTTKGQEVGDMVRRLVDKGVMSRSVLNDVDGGAQALREAIQTATMGGGDDSLRAAAESYYGAPEVLKGAYKEGVSAAPLQIPKEIVDRVVKGGDLQAVKQGIDQVISSAEGPQKRALMQLKNDYLKFMEGKSPEYIRANSIFADMSKPITEMSVAQRMVDTLTGEAYKHGGEAPLSTIKFLQAYRNAPLTARSVSGMKQPIEKIFTPDNLKTVRQVAREVSKQGDLDRLGKGVGSDTAQKIARSNMMSSLADLVNSNRVARASVNLATLGAKGRINTQLDAMLKSPEYAGKAFGDLTAKQQTRLSDLLAKPTVRAGLISDQSK